MCTEAVSLSDGYRILTEGDVVNTSPFFVVCVPMWV